MDKEEEAVAVPKTKSRSSRRSQKAAANRGLYVSPGLRFITRKDLYTFLTSAGVSFQFAHNRSLSKDAQTPECLFTIMLCLLHVHVYVASYNACTCVVKFY